jgi:chaperonin GroES
MKLTPTLDRVAIIREAEEEITEGGIILPDGAKEESNYGEVVAVGPGGFNMDGSRREMSVKVGDVVFFTDYHVTTTKSKVVIVDDEDILAVVKA